MKELGKITEKKRIFKSSTDRPLAEMLDMKEKSTALRSAEEMRGNSTSVKMKSIRPTSFAG